DHPGGVAGIQRILGRVGRQGSAGSQGKRAKAGERYKTCFLQFFNSHHVCPLCGRALSLSAYSASPSVSPVRIRTTCSSGVTKIFPSPIWPVFALELIASITASSISLFTATSILSLGRKLTAYSAPR